MPEPWRTYRRDEDPAYPERRPDLYQRIRCALCKACWFHKRRGECQHAGPFTHFVEA